MASQGRSLQIGIQIFLAIAIVALTYWLYVSITEPYAVVERQKKTTAETRDRMLDVRTAMVRYDVVHGRFVSTLDSLLAFIKTDSVLSQSADSIFGEGFISDSLIFSPRTGKMFELALNDTSRVKTYQLKDPDTDDKIGTLIGDVTQLNAASWE